RIGSYFEQAAPLVGANTAAALPAQDGGRSGVLGKGMDLPPAPDNQHSFLLVPGSDAGKAYALEAQKTLEDIHIVNVPGQADLMFCRELDYLRLDDVERIVRVCRNAYEEANTLPATSPHARCDIQDWTPLDP